MKRKIAIILALLALSISACAKSPKTTVGTTPTQEQSTPATSQQTPSANTPSDPTQTPEMPSTPAGDPSKPTDGSSKPTDDPTTPTSDPTKPTDDPSNPTEDPSAPTDPSEDPQKKLELDWLSALEAQDIEKVQTVKAYIAVAPGAFKTIQSCTERGSIETFLNECRQITLTPISKEDTLIDGGQQIALRFILTDGNVHEIYFYNGNYLTDGYFRASGIPTLDDHEYAQQTFSLISYSPTATVYAAGSDIALGEIESVSNWQFVPSESAPLEHGDAWDYRIEGDFGTIYVYGDQVISFKEKYYTFVTTVFAAELESNGLSAYVPRELTSMETWLHDLKAENVVSLRTEYRYDGVAPGSLSDIYTTTDAEGIADFLRACQEMRVQLVTGDNALLAPGTAKYFATFTRSDGKQYTLELTGQQYTHGSQSYRLLDTLPRMEGALTHRLITYGENTADILRNGEKIGTFAELDQLEFASCAAPTVPDDTDDTGVFYSLRTQNITLHFLTDTIFIIEGREDAYYSLVGCTLYDILPT